MIKLPAYLTGFSSKADGSAGIRFSTQELTADDFGLLKGDLNKFGWLIFKEGEIQDEDIPEDDAEEAKTPSQRVRAILFVEWKQKGKQADFNSYYRLRMDAICERLKSQLDK